MVTVSIPSRLLHLPRLLRHPGVAMRLHLPLFSPMLAIFWAWSSDHLEVQGVTNGFRTKAISEYSLHAFGTTWIFIDHAAQTLYSLRNPRFILCPGAWMTSDKGRASGTFGDEKARGHECDHDGQSPISSP